ncbi:MAG: DUF190 domain-containing protein [Streptosporangiales bacterium]|nr:DUF190 domain-containing protein [Streptosporangiales bacterium]
MRHRGPALRVSIFINDTDHWHHKPLYHEIVHRAYEAGLAGATVIRGVEGYGAGRVVHTMRILSFADNLPLIVIIVDDPDRVRAFLPQLDEIITDGTVVIDEVEAIHYTDRPEVSGTA